MAPLYIKFLLTTRHKVSFRNLFNEKKGRETKNKKRTPNAQTSKKVRNTISDAATQTSLSPIFLCVHRLEIFTVVLRYHRDFAWFFNATRAYASFFNMKWFGVFLLPHAGVGYASQLQGPPLQHYNYLLVPSYTLMWGDTLWEYSALPKNTTQWSQLVFELGPTQPAFQRTNH